MTVIPANAGTYDKVQSLGGSEAARSRNFAIANSF